MQIRRFQEEDWAATWQIIEPVFRAGETYAFSPEITEAEAHKAYSSVDTAKDAVEFRKNNRIGLEWQKRETT